MGKFDGPLNNFGICDICGRKIDLSIENSIYTNTHKLLCESCIESIANVYNNYLSNSEVFKETPILDTSINLKTPHEIKALLDDYIIGQEEFKEKIAVAVYNHYKRIAFNLKNNEEIEKSNIIVLGNSGTGKTLMAQTIAKILNVPFAISDCTSLTEAGYVGDDVENVITRLYQAAGKNIKETEKGIIFLDEIDKISRKNKSSSITRDVSGEGVQQALLKIIEGADVTIPVNGGRKNPNDKNVMINTKDILFICAGSFEGLEEKIKKRYKSGSSIGFNLDKENKKKEIKEGESYLSKVTPDDLKEYGLIPELVGRLPIITYTNPLTKDMIVNIITKPKNAILKQYKKLLEIDGTKLIVNHKVLDYIADKAIETKLGARGIRNVFENIMTKVMYDAPTTHIKSYELTLNRVKNYFKD